MSRAVSALDLFLAEWVLGRVSPERAVQLAIRSLQDGCDEPSVAVIAGSRATTRAEIDAELPRLLRALGTQLPTDDEALKSLVDDCAQRIADGRLDPSRGASMMWEFWANENEGRAFYEQVRHFISLADECFEPGPHVAGCRAQVVAEAMAFLDRGGLRLPL